MLTVAALEREGSRDQSAQPTTARPKSGAVQQNVRLMEQDLCLPGLDTAKNSLLLLYTSLKNVDCRSSQKVATPQLWNFTYLPRRLVGFRERPGLLHNVSDNTILMKVT